MEMTSEKEKLKERRRVHLDDVFAEYIGEGGKYQIFIVLLLAFNAFCTAGLYIDILWVADPKPHWCALPKDTNPSVLNLSLEERLDLTIPWIEVDNERVRDSCHMYDWNYSELRPNQQVDNSTPTTRCEAWEFDTSEFTGTIVEKVKPDFPQKQNAQNKPKTVYLCDPVQSFLSFDLFLETFRRLKAKQFLSVRCLYNFVCKKSYFHKDLVISVLCGRQGICIQQ